MWSLWFRLFDLDHQMQWTRVANVLESVQLLLDFAWWLLLCRKWFDGRQHRSVDMQFIFGLFFSQIFDAKIYTPENSNEFYHDCIQCMVELVITLYMKVLKWLASGWYSNVSTFVYLPSHDKILECNELNRGMANFDLVCLFRKNLNILFTRPLIRSCS
jgi:hypothetical protein